MGRGIIKTSTGEPIVWQTGPPADDVLSAHAVNTGLVTAGDLTIVEDTADQWRARVRAWHGPPPLRLDPLDFWNLFTDYEQETIDLAADTPGPVRRYRRQLQLARYIEQGHPLTEAGIEALVTAGLLTTARAARVQAFLTPEV